MTQLRVGPLVRAIDSTRAVIWVELSQACQITLRALPFASPTSHTIRTSIHTVAVGGHYYAAPLLQGLQPATWYNYHIAIDEEHTSDTTILTDPASNLLLCFRTLDAAQNSTKVPPLRLAYGSCRKLDHPEDDTLNAFGSWLMQHVEQREENWPHLLLLIGDQIYADDPAPLFLQSHPQLTHGMTTFADFAQLYTYNWTCDEGIRQVLAALPTFMIFDDHEIYNNWGILPTWQKQMVQDGKEQLLVDGLVAYWIYQGWGNLTQFTHGEHPLMQVMQAAEQSGEDILDTLRTLIKTTIYEKNEIPWHYTIPTMPPIFVTNTRANRTTLTPLSSHDKLYAPMRIMDSPQMNTLHNWMHTHDTTLSILVSSVPVLLPPLLGLAEYLTGMRLWQHSIAPLRWLGKQLARLQLALALRLSFDHWPTFAATWHELTNLLQERKKDILILGGDVHFSYAVQAQKVFAPSSSAHLYQLVSTPFQNTLEPRDLRMVAGQSFITRMPYGGLSTRILPLQTISKTARIQHNLLFNNTLAYVTLQPQHDASYTITQEYLGIIDGHMEVLAQTII